MISAVLVTFLAASPESVGSVDGPFLWADVRGSVDETRYEAVSGAISPSLSGGVASGISVLGQGHLSGGWGLRVGSQRLALTAALTGTAVVTDASVLYDVVPRRRVDLSPLLISAALPFGVDRVAFIPMLGLALPTHADFGTEPVLAVQPQLRFRAGFDSLIVGASLLANVPVVTTWRTPEPGPRAARRCPAEETHCRMPVMREFWRAGISAQAEHWFLPQLSLGGRLGGEIRNENAGLLVINTSVPDGAATIPGWLAFEASTQTWLSWAFADHFGVTFEGGLRLHRRAGSLGDLAATSWDAAISIWFRTDPRLQRMWLDR